MGKVYAPPLPAINYDYNGDWQKQEEEYTDLLKEWCNKHGRGAYRGSIVQFPVADGYAVYMIISLKPLELIHVPLGDAWEYQYIERLSTSDIRKEADNYKRMSITFRK